MKVDEDGTVTIDAGLLQRFTEAWNELIALEAHGVDNWDGYGDAIRCGRGEECDLCD